MDLPARAKLAIITICKGRLAHLQETLPMMLAQAPDEMLVVDYACPEGAGDWVEKNFPSVKVVRVQDDPGFNASRARNIGWAACSSPWVICLDADIQPYPGWLDWLRPRLVDENAYFRAGADNGSRGLNTYGMACISRKAFGCVGGYDEVFSNWGGEDTDFFERLAYAGFVEKSYSPSYLGRIDHTDSERTRFYTIKDPFVSQIANRLYSIVKQAAERKLQKALPVQERQRILNAAIQQSLRMVEDPTYVPEMSVELGDYDIRRQNSPPGKLGAARFKQKLVVTVEALDVLQEKPPLEAVPKISCLMVTKGRTDLIAQSLRCFVNQTYPNKELVIVTVLPDVSEIKRLIEDQAPDQVRLVHVSEKGMALGDLRNVAVDSAFGQFVCQWDDDDLYHPDRLRHQYQALLDLQAQACLLSRWMVWWPAMKRLAVSGERNLEGSLLCRKDLMPRYPSLRTGEDTPLVEKLIDSTRVVQLNMPALYLYVFHGGNTVSSAHFANIYNHSTEKFEGERYLQKYAEISQVFRLDDYPA